jgi:hypothetical protein
MFQAKWFEIAATINYRRFSHSKQISLIISPGGFKTFGTIKFQTQLCQLLDALTFSMAALRTTPF